MRASGCATPNWKRRPSSGTLGSLDGVPIPPTPADILRWAPRLHVCHWSHVASGIATTTSDDSSAESSCAAVPEVDSSCLLLVAQTGVDLPPLSTNGLLDLLLLVGRSHDG